MMFEQPSALDRLHNKAQQYEAAVKALQEASKPSERARLTEIERKQYYQYEEAKNEFEKEMIARTPSLTK